MTAMEQVRAACEEAGCLPALESIIKLYTVQLDILRDDLLEARRVRDDLSWRFENHDTSTTPKAPSPKGRR